MKGVNSSGQDHVLPVTVTGAVDSTRVSEVDQWLAWADHTAKDGSLRQGLQNSSLRALLRPMPRSLHRVANNTRPPAGQDRGAMTILSPTVAQHVKLARRFATQMLYGCTKGQTKECTVPFCRNNSRFTARIKQMSRFGIDAVSLELAQRACESPRSEERMPHSESELKGFGREEPPLRTQRASSHSSNSSKGSKSKSAQLFVKSFTMAVQRLLGRSQVSAAAADDEDGDEEDDTMTLHQNHRSVFGRRSEAMTTELEALSINSNSNGLQQPATLSPAAKLAIVSATSLPVSSAATITPRRDPPWVSVPESWLLCDESNEPLIAVGTLDANTAPLVCAIGGKLLCNTQSTILASPSILAQCFLSTGSDSPLGMDIAAAVSFFEDVKPKTTSTQAAAGRRVAALDAGISSIERSLRQSGPSLDKSALARAAAMLALYAAIVAPTNDKMGSALMVRIALIIVDLAYPSVEKDSSGGLALGWFSRYTQDNSMRQQWLVWWARVPAAVVRRWIAALQADALESVERLLKGAVSDQAMATKLTSGEGSLRWVGALELLRLLDDANYRLSCYQFDFVERLTSSPAECNDGNDSIKASEFCNSAMLKLVAMDKELVRWMDCMRFRFGRAQMRRQKCDAWTEENLFSLFLYPFLFDLPDKMHLFTTEVHNRMTKRYLAAHGRQAELVHNYRMVNIDEYSEQQVRTDVSPEWPLMSSSRQQVIKAGNPYLVFSVQRSSLLQDVMNMMLSGREGMSRVRFPLKVRFADGGEDGVDMGGVQKEMFALLIPQLLAPENGLFVYADDHKNEHLWPNAESAHSLEDFEAAGALLGMAFANGILIDSNTAPLAPLLVRQLAADCRSLNTSKMPLRALIACLATS
ncbi:hypothetical protein GGI21_001297, partial [Coemansia aciculifera]